MRLLLALCLVALVFAQEEAQEDLHVASAETFYKAPKLSGKAFLAETFDKGFISRWVKSAAKKEGTDEDIAKYNAEWEVKEAESSPVKGDVGLELTTKARHAAISAKLDKPFTFSGKPLIVQYEVKYQNGMDCGGSYMKLLSATPDLDLKQVTDKSGYTIMFGPDACGVDKKMHFIMRHKHPKTGDYEEKHAKKATGNLDFYSDKKTHLFRLTVNSDNSWEVHVDDAMINSGNLLTDMEPAINPPSEIDDPEDFKPADWDDREKIPDPDATKPIDWDEDAPETIPDDEAVKPDGWLDDEEDLIADPSAERPVDWDDEMDGEWEAPKMDNPACEAAPGCGEWTRPTKRNPDYRGKWRPEMIENPDYSGVWAPKRIPNPNFYEDKQPYKMTPIGAVAFELWSMTEGVLFDNILITDDVAMADDWTAQTWHITRDAEMAEAALNAEPMLKPMWDALEEMPWLWGVAVVALLIPIGIVFYCCVGGNKDDEVGERKKTDAPTPDDDVDVGDESKVDEKAGGDSSAPTDDKKQSSPSKSGRSALNKPAEDEDDEEDEDEATPSQDEQSPDDEGEAESTEQQEEQTTTRKSPRKRRARKE